ncbi:P-loop containing nucleoside triphosphate hydrolase protein [Neocallimastix californiae]|uniref:RNA helicase n=1 Tax=Neocallimastix californiae TaxID=1754190 RepID=A0A1Y2BYV3_9FUNG|nr:P-loop containing nucleoside triphosphate hydrolase protein [Neocallimastix californiae]|eukprot:ORY39245.1 P-loop containing nucleoside triphosphate hydrolase protein [Neocallimastix californiae]
MTSKKRKRFEKFVERQIKKENRIKMIEKLSKGTFTEYSLLQSSKHLGRGKETTKEKLRNALNQQRAGIAVDDNIKLYTERKEYNDDDMIEEFNDYNSEDDNSEDDSNKNENNNDSDSETSINRKSKKSSKVEVVEYDGMYGERRGDEVEDKPKEDPAEFDKKPSKFIKSLPAFGSALKSSNKSSKSSSFTPIVFGSALKKRKTSDDENNEKKTKKIKKKEEKKLIKEKQKQEELEKKKQEDEEENDTENDIKNENESENENESDNDNEKSESESESESESDSESDTLRNEFGEEINEDGLVKTSILANLPKIPEYIIEERKKKKEEEAEKERQRKLLEASKPYKPAFYDPVYRKDEIQLARLQLPVTGEEQQIMETIMENDVTILCGETGSGKTTQIPQFLYEAGFGNPKHPQFTGMIGVTQPRRVAAVSMAKRISEEMNLLNGEVAYQIRYDSGTVKPFTRIKFMTDGILLRELSLAATSEKSNTEKNNTNSSRNQDVEDLLLTKYSAIIIDEAHERTVGTDVLIGWLTRIVKLRNDENSVIAKKLNKPLKLIIMSATLRVDDFTQNKTLFPDKVPPVVKVDGRQHKVVVHYNKRTPVDDYITDVYKKICKIHKKLPSGGILVFLTGQQEIQILCKKLRKKFPINKKKNAMMIDNKKDSDNESSGGLHVLPLYSLLPTAQQLRVFEPPPENSRLCVIATNVAETSLTIPNIRYVVDTGKVKTRVYDPYTGIQTYQIRWTSKASADQRAGRAGRTGPGHCYRLFSSAVFNDQFEDFSKPEILKTPIDGVVVQMKSMGISQVINFPFPTAPNRDQLKKSEKILTYLGALDSNTKNLKITPLGKLIAKLPVLPRYGKMLVLAAQQGNDILPYVIAIVAGLSVGDPFERDETLLSNHAEDKDSDNNESGEDSESDEDIKNENDVLDRKNELKNKVENEMKALRREQRKKYYQVMQAYNGKNPVSDFIKLLTSIGAFEHFRSSNPSEEKLNQYCKDKFVRLKAMLEISKLRHQLTNLMKTVFYDTNITISQSLSKTLDKLFMNPRMPPPSDAQINLICQIILSGFPDQVAYINDSYPKNIKNPQPSYTTIYTSNQQFVGIHRDSSIYAKHPTPRWVVYQEMVGKEQHLSADQSELIHTRSSSNGLVGDKFWMKGITIIKDEWLGKLMTRGLCRWGRILEKPEPRYDATNDTIKCFVSPNYGPHNWPLSTIEVDFPSASEAQTVNISGMASKIQYFARFLLEGKIINCSTLNGNVQPLKKNDTAIYKIIYQRGLFGLLETQSKVIDITRTLATYNIDSKEKLIKKWSTDSKFLLSSYLLWVPSQLHNSIKHIWPPVTIKVDEITKEMTVKQKNGEIMQIANIVLKSTKDVESLYKN